MFAKPETKPVFQSSSDSTVHFTLDGVMIEAHLGQSLLTAMLPYVKVPNLCGNDYEGFKKPCQDCSLCLVEDFNSGKLIKACAVTCQEGLTIKSFSPTIRRARLVALKALVKKHSGHCLSCDWSGQCRLQNLCAEMGLAIVSAPNPTPLLTLIPAAPDNHSHKIHPSPRPAQLTLTKVQSVA
ncbi:MAG: (2Fe-2S)-binding protein [Deltaproteobacteria bacterium]|jgi:predicted molibdopterin-dependent oxidoreductase YjgC|nr:(2Fe-2S)-binding protein [Deltaproteobacteria bacterium]